MPVQGAVVSAASYAAICTKPTKLRRRNLSQETDTHSTLVPSQRNEAAWSRTRGATLSKDLSPARHDLFQCKPKGKTMSEMNIAEKAANTADNAIKSTQHATHKALDSLADGVQSLRQQAAPAINRAGALAQQGVNSVRDTAHQMREGALHATDSTVSYIKEEPIKAMLIAAATGAALMALLSLLARSSSRG